MRRSTWMVGILALACERTPARDMEPTAKVVAVETDVPAPTGRDVVDLYRRCMAAWSAHDAAAYSGCWAERVTIDAADVSGTPRTRDQVIDPVLGDFWTAFPDARAEPTLIVANGNTVAAIDLVTGTHTGELHGQPGSGKPVRFHVASVIEVDDQGQFVRLHRYGDLATPLRRASRSPIGQRPAPDRPPVETGWTGARIAVAGDTAHERVRWQVAESMNEAFNRRDMATFLALHDRHVVDRDYGLQRVATGRDAIERDLGEYFAGFADAAIVAEQRRAAGDWVVESGTLVRKVTGKPVALRYLTFLRIESGRVQEIHRFYRDLAFAQQIGVAPRD